MGLMVGIDWYTLQCSHYWTGLEDMAVHAHIQPCSSTSVEVEEEERPITVCVFSIRAFRTNSFLFFPFQGAFGNVLPWAVCLFFFLSASQHRLFLLRISLSWFAKKRQSCPPPTLQNPFLLFQHIHLFSLRFCDPFLSEGLTTAIILLIQKTDPF